MASYRKPLTRRLISSRGLAKFINKHTVKAGRPKIIQALRVVVRIESSDRLDFHQHGIFHQKVRDVSTGGDTVVYNSDGDLLPDHEAGLRQLVRQGIFVNLFKEPRSERIGDGESASNDTLGNFIETFAIRVHRRSSAVEILSCLGSVSLGTGRKKVNRR